MPDRFTRMLPVVALVGLGFAIVLLAVSASARGRLLADTGETRASVEPEVAKVLAVQPATLDDPSFRREVGALLHARYVETVWLISPDGRIVYAEGGTAASAPAGNVADLATAEIRHIAGSLDGVFADDQRRLLFAASAIQREGEHNDIYRHLVRIVHGRDGRETGMLGIAYAVSPALAAPLSFAYAASLIGFVVGIAAYWFSLPLWVWFDARARGDRAPGAWAGFVLIGNVVALAAYLLTRRPHDPQPGAAGSRLQAPES